MGGTDLERSVAYMCDQHGALLVQAAELVESTKNLHDGMKKLAHEMLKDGKVNIGRQVVLHALGKTLIARNHPRRKVNKIIERIIEENNSRKKVGVLYIIYELIYEQLYELFFR